MRFIRKHLNIIIIITVFIIISMVIILKSMLVKASSIEETLNSEIEIAEEQESKEKTEDKKYLCRERKYYGTYQRSFYLGDVEEENIEATFNNGILNISIPKKQEQNNNRTIEIK